VTDARAGLHEATPDELERWNARAVDAVGGHVYQSRAWAEHRATSGWHPRFLVFADGFAVLSLERSWPMIGGASAYLPRGPVPTDGDPARTAERLVAVTAWLAERGVDVLASDAEVPAASGYPSKLRTLGFRPIEEIQPSRHRMTLSLEGGEEAVLARIEKKTRNRIRRAERELTIGEQPDFDLFYDMLRATGERRRFGFGPRDEFVGWWRRAHDAGHLLYLDARAPDGAAPVAALLCYRHGGRLSTVHSADRAELRRDHPGALALLRWVAIRRAIEEGCAEMDLGGVDIAGARRVPLEGEPTYGLYDHKRAFGATWLELSGAHERVIRPWRYAIGRVTARLARSRS
jgi:lipid II:glycine glycyltransferase (peptidoglycan interpeptide bridge formation enzyme)